MEFTTRLSLTPKLRTNSGGGSCEILDLSSSLASSNTRATNNSRSPLLTCISCFTFSSSGCERLPSPSWWEQKLRTPSISERWMNGCQPQPRSVSGRAKAAVKHQRVEK
ncbi:hypothetical protein E2C01_096596 [Portunus trituberculatus]|uniref:Uncharacterized protein n=1 Tax=Portunus trituberculatus TaxID=210409 RepID=A0A5B7K377_PORTR|nr:hypothetical protein [Portunus trituberculatus]